MADKYPRKKNQKRYFKNRCSPYAHSPSVDIAKNLEKFVYGNFHYYYGYRNQGTLDSRLSCMKREWLTGKAVLDVGCNAGHVTLSIARDFAPKFIIGIDIDHYLIRVANKNAVYYFDETLRNGSIHPIACTSKYGPIAELAADDAVCEGKFPYNVGFIQGNYVPDSDEILALQQPEFDCILCLSVTKWIHLNWGDDGMRRTFLRMFAHLQPGGFLILEPQPFSSYRKKKKMSESIYENFANIKFFPEQFNDYLLNVVGFESCELIDVPAHSSKGFCRPIYLFKKSDNKPKHIFFNTNEEHQNNDHVSSEESDYSNYEELSD